MSQTQNVGQNTAQSGGPAITTSPGARRYARALMGFVGSEADSKRVLSELSSIVAAWKESAELRDVFENPKFDSVARHAVVDGLVSKFGIARDTRNFLCLLSDRRRLREIEAIASSFSDEVGDLEGRVRADVWVAAPLSESYYKELEKALELVAGKKVTIVRHEDPSLLSGVVAQVGDQVFDGSLKARLYGLRESLLK